MRREGRQHGFERTCYIRRSKGKVDENDSQFTKVPSKPTNHSKVTGKCRRTQCQRCHLNPPCKSKDKRKGAHKMKNEASGFWSKVVTGSSATGMLGLLENDDSMDYGYEPQMEETHRPTDGVEIPEITGIEEPAGIEIGIVEDVHGTGGFYEVGFVCYQLEEEEEEEEAEGWYFVEEM